MKLCLLAKSTAINYSLKFYLPLYPTSPLSPSLLHYMGRVCFYFSSYHSYFTSTEFLAWIFCSFPSELNCPWEFCPIAPFLRWKFQSECCVPYCRLAPYFQLSRGHLPLLNTYSLLRRQKCQVTKRIKKRTLTSKYLQLSRDHNGWTGRGGKNSLKRLVGVKTWKVRRL